jgi:FtsP/CotA-like multicopper oxidase with cupredoxin domain
LIAVLALLVAVILAPQMASALTPPVDLCATAGTATITTVAGSPVDVPIWGYTLGDCTGSPAPELPGPVLTFDQGQTVEVTLHNLLNEDTALYFPGQAMAPDLQGVSAYGGTTIQSKTYTFTASQAGTFLYEAGLLPNAQHQVAMGMYGMLVVTDTVTYDVDAPLVLSEIDPALNTAVDPASFDMRDYTPTYWLINGKAYPDTAPIAAAEGNSVLLRYANAGSYPHSMGLLGLDQTLMALDGSPLPYSRKVVVQNIAPGQTMEMAAQMPASVPTAGAKVALYDTNLLLHNSGAGGFGGMLTFIDLAPGAGGGVDTQGPVTSVVSALPSPTDGTANVTVTANVNDSVTGGSTIQAAQFVAGGVAYAMTATDGAFDTGSEDVTGVLTTTDLAALGPGIHTIYVRGQDVAGNWGASSSTTLEISDTLGPTTSGVVLSPNPSSGSVAVAVSATGNDSASGGDNIAAAEFFIDTIGADGSGVIMNVNQAAPIASLTGTISAATMSGLAEGVHTVYVHSQDSSGNWGNPASAGLSVDKTGPEAQNVLVTPDLLYARAAVRVDAILTDTQSSGVNSSIKRAEGFIGNVGADGTGFPLTPIDGLFNSQSEAAYVNIPLATINSLPAGTNTIFVHGQDSSGNWGDANQAFAVLTIMPEDIFADGFESGNFAAWSGTGGTPSVTGAAARTGSNGMEVLLAGTSLTGYAIDNSPVAEPGYHARFYFDPNSTATGNNAQPDIFVGYDASSTPLFRVQYQRTQGGNATYRVRAIVTDAGGTTTSGWVNITDSWTSVEVAWQSANPATFRLYVNGILRQSITGLDTSAFKLETVWLGPSGNLGNNVSGTMYFDDFVSKRTQYIGP